MTTDTATAARVALLTPAELRTLTLVAEGLSNKEIGAMLDRSYWTVMDHLRAAFVKLRVHDRTAAVVALFRAGVLS